MRDKMKDLELSEMDIWMECRFKLSWLASIFMPSGWLKVLRQLDLWQGDDRCIKRVADDLEKMDMGISAMSPDDDKEYDGWYWVGRRWCYWYRKRCDDAPRWVEDANGADMQGVVRGGGDE